MTCYVRPVEGGSVEAAKDLGLHYKLGRDDFPPDPGKANTLLAIAFNGGDLRSAFIIADMLAPLAEGEDGALNPRLTLVAMNWARLSARIDEAPDIREQDQQIYNGLAVRASGIMPDAEAMIEDWLRRNPGHG